MFNFFIIFFFAFYFNCFSEDGKINLEKQTSSVDNKIDLDFHIATVFDNFILYSDRAKFYPVLKKGTKAINNKDREEILKNPIDYDRVLESVEKKRILFPTTKKDFLATGNVGLLEIYYNYED